jgi:hypothetical protein
MRISLDRSQLLGFETRIDLDMPTTAAKVGSKTQGMSVATTSHSELAKIAPSSTALTFPSR